MRIGYVFPTGAEVALSVTQDNHVVSGEVDAWKVAHIARDVDGGRPQRVRLPAFDPATVPVPAVPQADGTAVLDLSSCKTAGQMVIDVQGGRKAVIRISDRASPLGYPDAVHFYPPVGADGRFIVEPGRNHRKFYVTAGDHGYTKAMIAAEAGVSESAITNAWLVASIYGRTEDKVLAAELGRQAFSSVLGSGSPDASHWFLMERGYTYNMSAVITPSNSRGESRLHPIVIGAWGVGARPIMQSSVFIGANRPSKYLLIRDLEVSMGATVLHAVAFENVIMRDGKDAKFQHIDGPSGGSQLTLRRCEIYNTFKPTPANGVDWQGAHSNRWQGIFVNIITGVVMEECTLDLLAWQTNYDSVHSLWNKGEYGQPPSLYSHGLYFGTEALDVFLRRNWVSRGASHAYQIRAGAYFIDNVAASSGIGMMSAGTKTFAHTSLYLGNVIENMASLPIQIDRGAQEHAFSFSQDNPLAAARLTSNIVAHSVDPNDPTDAWKTRTPVRQYGKGRPVLGDDSVILGWPNNENLLKTPAELQSVTLGKFFQSKGLGDGTLKSVYPVIQAKSAAPYMQELLSWYRNGFGLIVAERTVPTTVVFSPDTVRGEGFQWFNYLNWSTGDKPGTVAGDSADLRGNWVRAANETADLAGLALGTGARLEIVSGRISTPAITGTGKVDIWNCGQLHTSEPDMTGKPATIRGGRLRYQRPVVSDDLAVSGRSEVLFGPDFTLPAGKTMEICGSLPFVGWDGEANSTLTLKGTLRLKTALRVNAGVTYSPIEGRTASWGGGTATVEDINKVADGITHVTLRDFTAVPLVGDTLSFENDLDNPRTIGEVVARLPRIDKFRSGIFGDANPSMSATINLSGRLEIDARGLGVGSYTFLAANVINGDFSSVEITGLASERTAAVDKTATAVTLIVS